VTDTEIQTFNLTAKELRCMDGDVIDVFFKSENITIITNVTDPAILANDSLPNTTTSYELEWSDASCMEPWKHTL
jgi:hypothetical protein